MTCGGHGHEATFQYSANDVAYALVSDMPAVHWNRGERT